ncbi:hypothetical protein LK07_18625 [Streptomyces pluripotens]|uniref:Lipoprotein n=1 Tax=Streptomyces pluripotens TaxID=1355015 RepID=A0A221P0L5_9ACTN|nr:MULTISPECIES: hypothetical protein [Streptomyces]ARP71441.1 hypothetical protein LK06_017470 [Streptomyces pluripotens]ASN25692.1 hypothetical protein LK07_18625 [Streptomyces pluripotens]KIE25016.1 lipoprotein [Streptomyces sp. MUSC 125]MCH0560160.1 hypothetical protein [Streptomyces sp. MUM 16J]
MDRRQQHRRAGRTVVAVGIMCGLGAGAAGCSGGASAEGATGTGDPVATLHQAADALRGAGSSKASTAMEMATGGTVVTIRGKGVYDYRRRLGQLTVVLPEDPTGVSEHRPITELLTPGALFMKNRGAGVPADKWVRVETATLSDGNLVTGGATDPYAAAEVLRGTRTAAYVGQTKVGGTQVRHYRGTADLIRAAGSASADVRAALAAAAKGFATAEVPFDVYLDDEGRIRKLRQRFSFVNGHQKAAVAVASTTLLYDFGAPVEVRLPRPEDIYPGRIADDVSSRG